MPGRDEEAGPGAKVQLSLRLARDPATVTLARELAGSVLGGLGVASGCIDDIRLVLSEACTNAVKYAATADDYDVRLAVDEGRCTIEVLDSGLGFDLRAVSDEMPPPDAPSGRGVALMRYLTDELEFHSDPGQGTTVRMTKQLRMERDVAPDGPERDVAPDGPERDVAPGGYERDGPAETRPGESSVETTYDSNPPKPPR